MRNWTVRIVVVAALVAAAFVFRGRARPGETPEATVSAFFDAAESGDDEMYLRLTSGRLRNSLEGTRSQLGVDAFRESLRQSAAKIKGLAFTRNDTAPPGPIALDVEIVFADRNERQKMLLSPQRNGWTIHSIEAAQMVKPAIPYGTPVSADTGDMGSGLQ